MARNKDVRMIMDKQEKAIFLIPFFLIIVALAFQSIHILPETLIGSQFNLMLITSLVFIPFVVVIVYFIRM